MYHMGMKDRLLQRDRTNVTDKKVQHGRLFCETFSLSGKGVTVIFHFFCKPCPL